jgi:hypothetical protein
MLYESTKTLLQGILRALETPDDVVWDSQIESCKQALYEMHQMSSPSYKPYKTDRAAGQNGGRVPDTERLIRAMPHVKTMASAIRRRDQATAIQSGRAALSAM